MTLSVPRKKCEGGCNEGKGVRGGSEGILEPDHFLTLLLTSFKLCLMEFLRQVRRPKPFTFSFIKFDVKISSTHSQHHGNVHMRAFKNEVLIEEVSPCRAVSGTSNVAELSTQVLSAFLRGQGKKVQLGWGWMWIKRGVHSLLKIRSRWRKPASHVNPPSPSSPPL